MNTPAFRWGCLRTYVQRQPPCLRVSEDKKGYEELGIFLSDEGAPSGKKTMFYRAC